MSMRETDSNNQSSKAPDRATGATGGCVESEQLERYLLEQLSEAEEAAVRAHLEACDRCRAALERAAGQEHLWQDLRAHLADGALPESTEEAAKAAEAQTPQAQALSEVKRYLDPTDDPHMLGRIGGYEVVGLVGQGSTGIVLKALEPRLNRYVAIKLMSPVYASNGAARRRFEREGRAVAAVAHEHVVPIHAVDEQRGLPYIVMQYVAGASLQQRLERDGPLDVRAATRVGLQVARALAAAHAQGIVHRDVKPANVILESNVDRALVTDFGLARVSDDASMTHSGTISGTPQFMSPEQARGDAADHRSDLFSLGSLLYAACTARAPFRAETIYGVIHRVCETEPRPIREINPDVDPWLVAFIERLMRKAPGERFQSAAEVVELLSAELAHLQNPSVSQEPPRDWYAPAGAGDEAPRPGAAGWKWALAGLAATGLISLGIALTRGTEHGTEGALQATLFPALFSPQGEPVSDWDMVDWRQTSDDWNDTGAGIFEQKLEESIPVEPGGKLLVSVDRGDIVLVPGELDRISVTVLRRMSAATMDEAQGLAAEHDVRLVADGDTVSLTAALPAGFAPLEGQPDFERILYRIVVPREFDPALETLSGDVSVGAVSGKVVAQATAGDVELARIDGSIDVRTTAGNVDASAGCTGGAEILSVAGDVWLAGCDRSARVRTSNGSVWLGGSKGDVYCQTSGGGVLVDSLEGPTTAVTSIGDILVRLNDSPRHRGLFMAGQGDVEVAVATDVEAAFEARENFDAAFELELEQVEERAGIVWETTRLNDGVIPISAASTGGSVSLRYLEAGEGLGGSDYHGRDSLGGSGPSGSGGLSGTGLGGSGGSSPDNVRRAVEKTSGEPRAGALVSVEIEGGDTIDGYTLYLPVSYGQRDESYPVIVYLQGSYGVTDDISVLNNWGLPRLLRDEEGLSSERNRLLLDRFIVVSPHMTGGQYHDEPQTVDRILEDVLTTYGGDPDRVYLTGVSRGGHGTWGLAAALPGTFAAIAPAGSNPRAMEDYSVLRDTAVWIAQNQGDGTTPYGPVEEAARRIEVAADRAFLRTDMNSIAATDYLDRQLVFTSAPIDEHDSWTELYTSVEFYRWLLEQELGRPAGGKSVLGEPKVH